MKTSHNIGSKFVATLDTTVHCLSHKYLSTTEKTELAVPTDLPSDKCPIPPVPNHFKYSVLRKNLQNQN